MNILMILEHHYPPDIRVEKEIGTLIGAGHNIVLACLTQTGRDESEQRQNLTIVRKKISSLTYKTSVGCLKFPFYFNFWRKFLQSVVKTYPIDIIHLHDLRLSKVVLEFRKELKIPFILDSHENYPYMLESAHHTQTFLGRLLSSTRQWLKYEEIMLNEADIVLSIVEEQKERFIKLGLAREKTFIVSNTPVYVEIEESPSEPGKFTYVYAGNIYLTKGLETMIKAFRLVQKEKSDVRLWIVGDKKKWDRCSRSIQDVNKLNIKCWGWKELDSLLAIIAKADVALLPHKKNRNSDYGMPNKLFQYMMTAKPVIASNCIPIERIIQETGGGLTYQADDYEQLAEMMLYLYKNRRILKEMGVKGKKAVSQKYNWSVDEKNLLSAYKSIRNG